MAFEDNIKEITPALTELKTGTPAIKVGGKLVVGGIGGNYIPAGQVAPTDDLYVFTQLPEDIDNWQLVKQGWAHLWIMNSDSLSHSTGIDPNSLYVYPQLPSDSQLRMEVETWPHFYIMRKF